jgi:putative phosphoribosyl transferase
MSTIFTDRREAGRALAEALAQQGDLTDPVVLALPRGGLPVGREIARALGAPLDIMVVRKLGLPSQPELAMGAVASGGIRVTNPDVLREAEVPDAVLEDVARAEQREVERRERAYRGDRAPLELEGRSVILVDDGIATGSTVRAAIQAARARGAAGVIVAAPVAPPETVERLSREADQVVCLTTPVPFMAISLWYRSFPQVDDREVRRILDEAAREGTPGR